MQHIQRYALRRLCYTVQLVFEEMSFEVKSWLTDWDSRTSADSELTGGATARAMSVFALWTTSIGADDDRADVT